MRGKRSGLTLAVLVAIGLIATAATAGATVMPTRDAPTLAGAMDFATGAATLPTIPPTPSNPLGVGTTPVAPFPRTGPTFAVLTTGDATQADLPGGNDSSDDLGA